MIVLGCFQLIPFKIEKDALIEPFFGETLVFCVVKADDRADVFCVLVGIACMELVRLFDPFFLAAGIKLQKEGLETSLHATIVSLDDSTEKAKVGEAELFKPLGVYLVIVRFTVERPNVNVRAEITIFVVDTRLDLVGASVHHLQKRIWCR